MKYCSKCGKQLADDMNYCPVCGAQQRDRGDGEEKGKHVSHSNHSFTQRTNIMCIIGLIVSVVSFLFNSFGLIGVTGAIISIIALSDCKKKNENGKVLAIVGIVLGLCSMLWGFYSLFVTINAVSFATDTLIDTQEEYYQAQQYYDSVTNSITK